MSYTPEQKEKLQGVLHRLSTPEEVSDFKSKNSILHIQKKLDTALAVMNSFDKKQSEHSDAINEITLSVERQKKSIPHLSSSVVEAFGLLADSLVNKLEEIKVSLSSSKGQSDFGIALQQIVRGLSGVERATKENKPPVWRWPQYLYSGIRNTQFEPINPATEEKQDSILAAITAISIPPAITNYALETGGNLTTIAGKDFATQATLALIKTKTDNIPSLGQALAAASVPIVLTAAQLSTLTPFSTVTATPALSTAPVFGQSRVATAGTAVQLSSGVLTNGVIVTALTTNTGTIIIGGSGVTNTINGTGNGVVLVPGQSTSFAVDNVNRLYINSTVNNDGVSWGGS